MNHKETNRCRFMLTNNDSALINLSLTSHSVLIKSMWVSTWWISCIKRMVQILSFLLNVWYLITCFFQKAYSLMDNDSSLHLFQTCFSSNSSKVARRSSCTPFLFFSCILSHRTGEDRVKYCTRRTVHHCRATGASLVYFQPRFC